MLFPVRLILVSTWVMFVFLPLFLGSNAVAEVLETCGVPTVPPVEKTAVVRDPLTSS